jgi:hypothetical protein
VVEVPRLLFDLEGAVVDTLELVPTRVSLRARELEQASGTVYVFLSPPAADSGTSDVALESGSVVVHWAAEARRGTLTVTRTGLAGDTTLRSDFRYDPLPLPEGYLDSVAAARPVRPGTSRADSLELFRAYRAALQMPPHFTPVARPRAGEEGGVWIRWLDSGPAVNRWLVVADDGEVRGQVDLTPRRADPVGRKRSPVGGRA